MALDAADRVRVEEIGREFLGELCTKLSEHFVDPAKWDEAMGSVLGMMCDHGMPLPDSDNSRIRFAEAFNKRATTWALHYISR